jgi:hypothetical protein
MCIHRCVGVTLFMVVVVLYPTAPVADTSTVATSSTAPAAHHDTIDYARTGKQLRHELKEVYANLKRTHALGSPRKGNDVTDVVLKYIPVGTSFDAAEAILRGGGFQVGPRPADIRNPGRSFYPQEPELAKLHLEGWLTPHYVGVSLVPRANGDYSVVTGVSAAIVMAYP